MVSALPLCKQVAYWEQKSVFQLKKYAQEGPTNEVIHISQGFVLDLECGVPIHEQDEEVARVREVFRYWRSLAVIGFDELRKTEQLDVNHGVRTHLQAPLMVLPTKLVALRCSPCAAPVATRRQ